MLISDVLWFLLLFLLCYACSLTSLTSSLSSSLSPFTTKCNAGFVLWFFMHPKFRRWFHRLHNVCEPMLPFENASLCMKYLLVTHTLQMKDSMLVEKALSMWIEHQSNWISICFENSKSNSAIKSSFVRHTINMFMLMMRPTSWNMHK